MRGGARWEERIEYSLVRVMDPGEVEFFGRVAYQDLERLARIWRALDENGTVTN